MDWWRGESISCYLINELQRTVDMYVRMGRVPQDVLYGPNDYTPHEAAPLELRFPLVQGIYLPQHVVGKAHMSNGLRVRRFAPHNFD